MALLITRKKKTVRYGRNGGPDVADVDFQVGAVGAADMHGRFHQIGRSHPPFPF